jgi:hypothetical protein
LACLFISPKSFKVSLFGVRFGAASPVWQLLHAPNAEEGIVDTVMRGGDTDTNAAICGALLGAAHGLDALPNRWKSVILDCRPLKLRSGIAHPRPRCFWPVDALELATALTLSPALLECLRKGLTPLAHDKPGSVYFDDEGCSEERLRELMDWGIIEWDDEFELYWPTALSRAIIDELPYV